MEKKNFIEYDSNEEDYDSPIGVDNNCECRVYCDKCGKKYIIGHLYGNGDFKAETGQHCDLRNQVWNCSKCLN